MIDRTRITKQLTECLTETHFEHFGKKYEGKVRDTYELGDHVVIITTDRQSAFDRVLAAIPFKGQVLNQVSAWWFEQTKSLVPNHMITVPDPNIMVVQKCHVFPIEFIVRGYLTGVTSTSVWKAYAAGDRDFCGVRLPDQMVKNQAFAEPIITPNTKSEAHDEPITPDEIVRRGLMTQTQWDACARYALALFRYGQELAQRHGLILVDTKYEFGRLPGSGDIVLVDEIHTPDSSRYWLAATYAEKFARGEEPDNIDKEFLRLWFVEHCDPYHDAVLPPAPEELVIELSARYIQLYEMITGQEFMYPAMTSSVSDRIGRVLEQLH